MKKFNLLVTIVCFLLAAGLFLIGISIYETKANVLTIVGALFVIPAARFMTVWILFLPHKSVTEEEYNKVFKAMKAGNLLYADVLFTSTEKAYAASFVVVTGDKIFAYAEKNVNKLEEYLKDILKRRAFAIKATCTDDKGKFMNFLKSADAYGEKVYESAEEKEADELERKRLCEVLESFMA
ncbi:MAG: hypothetical protein K6A45_04670 [Lachnospiraceae bacterium]|nr:hypothetical protein [Lachnospiraceae bacterium]